MGSKLTTEDFIKRAKETHGDRYDYDNVEYTTINNFVTLKCLECGRVFDIKARDHIDRGRGCKVCSGRGSSKMTTDDFLNRLHKKRGYLGYDFRKFEYMGNQIKSIVTCFEHGDFKITPNDLLFGYGCKQCGLKKITGRRPKTINYVLDKINDVHDGNIFIYEDSYVKVGDKADFKCNVCGLNFSSRVGSVLSGVGCPNCRGSKNEIIIKCFLKNKNIEFISQYPICVRLKADFYLIAYNLIIEYNGIQHYRTVNYFGGIDKLLTQAKRDIIKKHYCLNNNIHFLEIPYWEKDNIEAIIQAKLSQIT